MLFDINTAIGHWPFRKLPDNDASSLRQLLESHKITMAAVANINGIFYKNTQDANLELAVELAPHRDFFIGVATLNPVYAAFLPRQLILPPPPLNWVFQFSFRK